MATQYAPSGLGPSRPFMGLAPSYATNPYLIKSTYTAAIGFGDLVESLGSSNAGYVGIYTAGDTHALGVFAGCQYYSTTTQQWIFSNQWPSGGVATSGNIIAFVIDDPQQVYTIQVSGGPVLQASVGLNADLVTNGTPNSTTGISTAGLDYSTVSTTSTLPLRIIAISTRFLGGIDPTTGATPIANNYVDVRLNTSEFNLPTGI